MQATLPFQNIAIPTPLSPPHCFTFQSPMHANFDEAIFDIIGTIITNGSDDDGRAKSEASRAIRAYCAMSECVTDDLADALVDVIAGRCNVMVVSEAVATFASDAFIARLFATASARIEGVLREYHCGALEGIADLRGRIALCVSFENLTLARGFAGIKCIGDEDCMQF
jgi:hypothetical protein